VGLLASTVVGGLVVVFGRSRGWLLAGSEAQVAPPPADADAPRPALEEGSGTAAWVIWAVNLALAGLAVLIGVLLLAALRWGAARVGGGLDTAMQALPVFPLALAGSLLVRLALERSGHGRWASAPVQTLISTVSADLLITAATACLDLSLLRHDWVSLSVLAVVGLAWNLLVLLLLAPRILPSNWFERGIIEFGQATGVAASGLLLLRMADPDDLSDALPAFSIKQLILQPLIAGGVITVMAPLAISGWGLSAWTALCLGLVVLWVTLGLLLARRAI
jgi:ESS family glutamate:Na+ symporter